MRFTLRDLFWLTVVVSLVLGLWVQRYEHERQLGVVRRHANALRRELDKAQINESVYYDKLTNVYGFGPLADEGEAVEVDWELATREIP